MDRDQLESALKSIGKKSFVEDYEVYKNQRISPKERIKILTEKYSSNGATIRVSFADKIFQQDKEKEALKIIIESARITADVKVKAKKLLQQFN